MRQLLLFELEDDTSLAVGDHVYMIETDDYVGIPDGTRGVIIRIHPDDGCTVRWDDYTPTRPNVSKKHEYACYRASLRKLPFAEVRCRQLDDAIKELQKYLS